MAQELVLSSSTSTAMSINEALKTHDPELVDQALLASLPHSVKSTLREKRADRVGEFGYDSDLVGYQPISAPAEDIEASLVRVNATLRPVSSMRDGASDLNRLVGRLRLATKARPESQDDLTLMLALYTERLEIYPLDVITDVIDEWIRTQTWWPSWAELQAGIDKRLRRRCALKNALEEACGGAEPEEAGAPEERREGPRTLSPEVEKMLAEAKAKLIAVAEEKEARGGMGGRR